MLFCCRYTIAFFFKWYVNRSLRNRMQWFYCAHSPRNWWPSFHLKAAPSLVLPARFALVGNKGKFPLLWKAKEKQFLLEKVNVRHCSIATPYQVCPTGSPEPTCLADHLPGTLIPSKEALDLVSFWVHTQFYFSTSSCLKVSAAGRGWWRNYGIEEMVMGHMFKPDI